MSNIKIDIIDNGITTLATAGKYCDRNVEIAVNVPSSGGGDIEVEPLVLTGNCSNVCSGVMPSTYIKLFGDTVSTEEITHAGYMFEGYTNETIPFDINFKLSTSHNEMMQMFYNCRNLKAIPKLNNVYPGDMKQIFARCYMLKELPEDFGTGWNMSRLNSYAYNACNGLFEDCYSLRKIPKSFIALFSNTIQVYNYCIYKNFTFYCYSLDELNDMVVNTTAYSSDAMRYLLYHCYRVKDFTFEVNEDRTPKTAPWSQQTLDFTYNCGHAPSYNKREILNYNSGITADKEVIDDATYQALKNDPDWFTCDINYSRYNHDSAVKTINSLPIVTGGNNTIKFTGAAGAKTDGGAINTLTPEEIAVATARGWTVTLK